LVGFLFHGGPFHLSAQGANPNLTLPTRVNPPDPGAPPPLTVDAFLKADAEAKESTVPNGTPETHFTFTLTNISSTNVTINNAVASCGCTVAKLPEQPWVMAPGSSGEIHVTMNIAGKLGSVPKDVTIYSDKGNKRLRVISTILPTAAAAGMSAGDREKNQRMAITDRQAVFRGDCAQCHAQPAANRMGKELFESACGVCHESEHRATMVPDLHKIQQETNAEFWRNWITHGKPESLMPAFAKSEGGILSDAQIESLVNYLVAAVPSHATAQAGKIPGPGY